MPELPEIEVIKRGLSPPLRGALVDGVHFYRDDLRDPIPKDLILDLTANQLIEEIFRRSKYLIWRMPRGFIFFHMGMTGNLLVRKEATPVLKHTHLIIHLQRRDQEKTHLHFVDPRRFGRISALRGGPHAWKDHPYTKNLGFEPLDHNDISASLWDTAQTRSQPIKSFLMDSKVVVGIGNIYASESLFAAEISPLRPANTLNKTEFQNLVASIRSILRKAIKAGGSTIRDYQNSEGKQGYFAHSFRVYGRGGETCFRCASEVQCLKLGGRSTYFCPSCQR